MHINERKFGNHETLVKMISTIAKLFFPIGIPPIDVYFICFEASYLFTIPINIARAMSKFKTNVNRIKRPAYLDVLIVFYFRISIDIQYYYFILCK